MSQSVIDIESLVELRRIARRDRDFATADRLKGELLLAGWGVNDLLDGSSTAYRTSETEAAEVQARQLQRKEQESRRVEKRQKLLDALALHEGEKGCDDPEFMLAIRSGRQRSGLKKRLRMKCKRTRGADFASWLIQAFGSENLVRPEGTVLDVAGGHGDLAWALVGKGVSTTVSALCWHKLRANAYSRP